MGVLSLLFPLLPKYRPPSSCSPLGLSSRSLLHLSTRDSPLAASLSPMERQAVAVVGTELVRALLPSLPPQRASTGSGQETGERDGGGSAWRGGLECAQPLPLPFPCSLLPLSSPSLCFVEQLPPPLSCWGNRSQVLGKPQVPG